MPSGTPLTLSQEAGQPRGPAGAGGSSSCDSQGPCPQECRVLKNFSSLYAILSALQSNAIHRLKKTWEEVSRWALSPGAR